LLSLEFNFHQNLIYDGSSELKKIKIKKHKQNKKNTTSLRTHVTQNGTHAKQPSLNRTCKGLQSAIRDDRLLEAEDGVLL
jgi:hypothetical protein